MLITLHLMLGKYSFTSLPHKTMSCSINYFSHKDLYILKLQESLLTMLCIINYILTQVNRQCFQMVWDLKTCFKVLFSRVCSLRL